MARRESVEQQLACVERFLEFWSLKRASAMISVALACWWAENSIRQTRWFEGMLPAALHTAGLATVGHDATLIERLGLLPYKSCGGAVFSLTEGYARCDPARWARLLWPPAQPAPQ